MGIGGITAFSLGALMLFDTEVEAFWIGCPSQIFVHVDAIAFQAFPN
jgi:hypothetical protein